MFPDERSLVNKLKSRPFVLLGVNTDGSADEVTQKNKQQKITWRSWFDGKGGPITKRYDIKGFPSLFVLDHKGIIRKKYLGAPDHKQLESLITKLLKDAEKGSEAASADEKPSDDKSSSGASGNLPAIGLEEGKRAPEINGKDTTGKSFRLSEYKGKVVLLDFWGFW